MGDGNKPVKVKRQIIQKSASATRSRSLAVVGLCTVLMRRLWSGFSQKVDGPKALWAGLVVFLELWAWISLGFGVVTLGIARESCTFRAFSAPLCLIWGHFHPKYLAIAARDPQWDINTSSIPTQTTVLLVPYEILNYLAIYPLFFSHICFHPPDISKRYF